MSTTLQAGRLTREQRCQAHNRKFYQVFFPDLQGLRDPEIWVGECDLCAIDDRLERQARDILARRGQELHQRVNVRIENAGTAAKIAGLVDLEIERRAQVIVDEMEAGRNQIEAEIRRGIWEKAQADEEAELLAEIVQELRKGGQ